MAKVPTKIVIAAFHEEEAAGQVAEALRDAWHYIRKDEPT